MLAVVFVVMLTLQVSAKNEKSSGPFGAIWEAIRNLQQQINEIITMEAPVELVSDSNEPTFSAINEGEGSAGYFGGDVEVTGDLILDGKLVVDSIDVSQITGLIGEGYTLKFPDVLDNSVHLGSSNLPVPYIDKAVIVQGPGYDVERIEAYGPFGQHDDQPGFTMAYPFIFECGGRDAEQLREIFDQYYDDPYSISPDGSDFNFYVESFDRQHLVEIIVERFVPDGYEESIDGRTRFNFVHVNQPNNPPGYYIHGYNFNDQSVNPETDTLVEVIGFPQFYPNVEIDESDRKITFTFDYNEGGFIYNWVQATIRGKQVEKRDIRIAEETEPGIPGTEIRAERQYYGCFPVRFEMMEGFGLLSKLKTQVVLSYDWFEEIQP